MKLCHDEQILLSDPDLGDDFWGGVDYCAYLRRSFTPVASGVRSLFVNRAYARLVGIDADEMMDRCNPSAETHEGIRTQECSRFPL